MSVPIKNEPRILFLSHGGGPMPLLGDVGHREMVACLQDIAAGIKKAFGHCCDKRALGV